MLNKSFLAVLLAALAFKSCAGSSAPMPPALGGWDDVEYTDELHELLMTALKDQDNYYGNVVQRLCLRNVLEVSAQVVAGTNYDFNVEGCDKTFEHRPLWPHRQRGYGECFVGERCNPVFAHIRVFDQPWTNSHNVTSIEFYQQ